MLGLCLNKESSHSSLEGGGASLTWALFARVCNRVTEASLTQKLLDILHKPGVN